MLPQFAMLAALGAACAGCSAPSIDTTLAGDNPANPDAAAVPFVRPVDVLAEGAAPLTSLASVAMPMTAASMPGMSGDMAAMPDRSPASGPGMSGVMMAQAPPQGAGQAEAVGTVNAIDATGRTVNVTHQPIKVLGWPSMTMDFPVTPSIDLGAVKPGDRIAFTLGQPDAEGSRRIVQLKPAPGSAGRQRGKPGMDSGAMPGMKMPDGPP